MLQIHAMVKKKKEKREWGMSSPHFVLGIKQGTENLSGLLFLVILAGLLPSSEKKISL